MLKRCAGNLPGCFLGGGVEMDSQIARMWDCENPLVLGISKEPAHTIWAPYDSVMEAAARKKSKYTVSLDGEWNFKWIQGTRGQIPDFYNRIIAPSDGTELKCRPSGS
jgi:hypothetical protein